MRSKRTGRGDGVFIFLAFCLMGAAVISALIYGLLYGFRWVDPPGKPQPVLPRTIPVVIATPSDLVVDPVIVPVAEAQAVPDASRGEAAPVAAEDPEARFTRADFVHAVAQIATATATGILPDNLSAQWIDVLSLFPSHLRAAFDSLACTESDRGRDLVGPVNTNSTVDYGPWMINSRWFAGIAYPTIDAFPESAKTDLKENAVAAIIVWGQQGFSAWSSWQGSASATYALARIEGNCVMS